MMIMAQRQKDFLRKDEPSSFFMYNRTACKPRNPILTERLVREKSTYNTRNTSGA
jgi:hypothetical protein